MTTYPATNLQLTYDDATNQWNYTEVAYDYGATPPPSWSGYTGEDPAYEYATENGGDNYGNYLSLIRERNKELVYSMDTETNTFPKELLR